MNHKDTKSTKAHKGWKEDALSRDILDAALEVHRALGPGLLESGYEFALCHELELRGIPYRRQVPVSLRYKGLRLDAAYRIDLVVEDLVIVELKAVDRLEPIHEAQLLSYLRHTDLWLGMLLNFHAALLRNGVKRIVNGPPPL